MERGVRAQPITGFVSHAHAARFRDRRRVTDTGALQRCRWMKSSTSRAMYRTRPPILTYGSLYLPVHRHTASVPVVGVPPIRSEVSTSVSSFVVSSICTPFVCEQINFVRPATGKECHIDSGGITVLRT
jgi:hypothetical protein